MVINAAMTRINFPDRRNAAGTTMEWKTPAVLLAALPTAPCRRHQPRRPSLLA